jgi:putative toxin-antitoxin system antitoxin component (TIGR02293 family)
VTASEGAMGFRESRQEITEVDGTVELLGGSGVLDHRFATTLETHDLLERGLPTGALDHLVDSVSLLRRADVLERAVGISDRTYYRRKKDTDLKPLSREQSGRVWKFAELLSRATRVMGSQEAAERWLAEPAIGLDNRRPVDLLSTPAGVELVEDYLARIDYGVYA